MPLFVPIIPPVIISNEAADYNAAVTIVLSALVPICYAFELQTTVVVLGGKWYMGATAAGNTNMGIYTFAGSLVAGSDSGAIANAASQINSFTYGTAVPLSPGQYFMVLASSNGTDTYYARSMAAANTSHRGRRCANVVSAGALPATMGALNVFFGFPACSLTLQGGL